LQKLWKRVELHKHFFSKGTNVNKAETQVTSGVNEELTAQIVKTLQGALSKGLEALNDATRTDPDLPHGYDATFEWIRLDQKGGADILGAVAFRLSTALLKKEGDGWKEIPAYCENQGFDIPEISDALMDTLHDTVLRILFHFYSTSLSIQQGQLK
jgi:hypothetical protein